jgi:SAM-dependent methyltransferase
MTADAPPAPGLAARLLTRAVDALRLARTGVLVALGPFDLAWRWARGRRHLPPLWLRRHVGPVGEFERAARAMGELIAALGLVRPGDRVVDLGCGCGAMVPELARQLGPAGRYLGIDVHAPSIRWCRRRHRGDARLRFELAPVRSPYGGWRGPEVATYRLPVTAGGADFVLAKSLFTHLLEEEARAYLCEVRRVLAPGRRALVTAFLFDGAGAAPPPAFPHPAAAAAVRFRRALRPHAAVAYEAHRCAEMVAAAGLAVERRLDGFFPGTVRVPRGQDVLVLAPTEAPAARPSDAPAAAGRTPS